MPTTGPTVTVKVIDHGWEDIRHRILSLGINGATVKVGVQGTEAAANHQHSHMTVAQIAQVHEFGKVIHQPKMRRTIVIPERSFLRRTVEIFEDAILRRESLLALGYIHGKFALRTGLELFGMYVVGLVQQRIADGIPPENAPSTKARKKSSKPLIDTGQLRQSITHKAEL